MRIRAIDSDGKEIAVEALVKKTPDWCENKLCENPNHEGCRESEEVQLCSRDKRFMVERMMRAGGLKRAEAEAECRKYGVRTDWGDC